MVTSDLRKTDSCCCKVSSKEERIVEKVLNCGTVV